VKSQCEILVAVIDPIARAVRVNRPYQRSFASHKLDSGSSFLLDGSVSAQSEAAAFATTHWSVVLTAQGRSPAADDALEKLCRTYWWPLYGFVRRNGYGPEEAQDLTQGFFALLLERHDFDVVRQEKGRLRSYLLVSLKNFLAKARRRELAVKRGEGRTLMTTLEAKRASLFSRKCTVDPDVISLAPARVRGFSRRLHQIHFIDLSVGRAPTDAKLLCRGGHIAIRGINQHLTFRLHALTVADTLPITSRESIR
jgi:hypothetical protein